MKLLKWFGKIILFIFGILIIVIAGIAAIVWLDSSGEPQPLVNTTDTGISSIEKINLGGLDQYLIIRASDTVSKPVMLFLHGGPGSPEFTFLKETNPALEDDYIMVYWEQRGAGKSFSPDIDPASMNINQFIDDTKQLSEYLIKRFDKEKIYLLGHSWGSFLGIQTAYKYPELYHAYLGVGQVANQYEGEWISFEWIKQQAEINGHHDVVDELNDMVFPGREATSEEWMNFLLVERNYVGKYGGGVTREMTSIWPVLKMLLAAEEYTLSDKINYMRGSMFSLTTLWNDVVQNDLNQSIDSMSVPVYIFQGVYDYQTPYAVAQDFYNGLKAPEKAFYTFENSAHSPLMEEVEIFNQLLSEIANRYHEVPR